MTPRPNTAPDWAEFAKALAEDGCPITEIAETVGAGPSTVGRWAHPAEEAKAEWLRVRQEIGGRPRLRELYKELMTPGAQKPGGGTRVQRSSDA